MTKLSVKQKLKKVTKHKQNPRQSTFLSWKFYVCGNEGERTKYGRMKEDFEEAYRKIILNDFK